MAIQTAHVEHELTELAKQIMDAGELSEEEAQRIIELMQIIEDKLSDALAHHGIEIGDERVD